MGMTSLTTVRRKSNKYDIVKLCYYQYSWKSYVMYVSCGWLSVKMWDRNASEITFSLPFWSTRLITVMVEYCDNSWSKCCWNATRLDASSVTQTTHTCSSQKQPCVLRIAHALLTQWAVETCHFVFDYNYWLFLVIFLILFAQVEREGILYTS